MKIIISPSKLQNPTLVSKVTSALPTNTGLTQQIKNRLMADSRLALGERLKIKGSLLDQAYSWLHNEMPIKGHAVVTYTGIVFKEITPKLYAISSVPI